MADLRDIIASRRERVLQAYNSAKAENHNRFLEGDVNATAEYIFPNQLEDANAIVQKFYEDGRRITSVQKLTKVGADGLMIEILKLMTTHPDDDFVVNPANVRILTGMSNAKWEEDMINKAPAVFKDKIYHHGQLKNAKLTDLQNMNNSFIIIDEIDTGDKEGQRLHTLLKESGILNVKHMIEHNNRFVVISATMIKELYAMYQWGELHDSYTMTVPPSYIGHSDFLKRGIIQEFYSLKTPEDAERWVKEDIIDYYGTDDKRIHIARVNKKTAQILRDVCISKGIMYRDHTSTDILTKEEEIEFFEKPLTGHIVLGVKGFYRRANLIPNKWKLRIGATHELYTKDVDNNVQIQGLPGRMSGHWRKDIEAGHKTGPHRTSCKAIEEYEKVYKDPFGRNSYTTSGFTKRKGKVSSESTMLSPKNIENLEAVDLPVMKDVEVDINLYRIYADEEVVRAVCKILGYTFVSTKCNSDGFKETSLNNKKSVVSVQDAVKKVPTAYGTNGGVKTYRTYYPCYVDITNNTSLRFVVIIRPGTDESKVEECDTKFTPLPWNGTATEENYDEPKNTVTETV